MRRRRWAWAASAIAASGAILFVVAWFQPQKLFIDDRVDEPSPARANAVAPVPDTTRPRDVASGTFTSLDHKTSGRVRILEIGDNTRVVRLEGLDTSNGPDLYLYLSPNPATGPESAFDDAHLNLGHLKGNLGDQNYELPVGTDLTQYRSIVIWCDRFNSAFGAADLQVAQVNDHTVR